jgi:hypothetical protein
MGEMIEVKGIEAFQISPRTSVCSRTAMEVFFVAVTRCVHRFILILGSTRRSVCTIEAFYQKGRIYRIRRQIFSLVVFKPYNDRLILRLAATIVNER